MKVSALVPEPSLFGAFDYRSAASLPDTPGCYVLSNASADIIYLGQAASLKSRITQHLDAGRQRELTVYGRASLLSILRIDEPIALSAHERGWLNQCILSDGTRPPLNKIDAPI